MTYKDYILDKINEAVSNYPNYFYLLFEREEREGYEIYGFDLIDTKIVKKEIAEDFSDDLQSFNEPIRIVGYCEQGKEWMMIKEQIKDPEEEGVETNE